jgi:hypothetical protein
MMPQIRAALFNRLLPSMLEASGRVCMPAQAWESCNGSKDASVQYVPEQQSTTALRIKPEELHDVPAIVHRSSPPIRSVVVTAKKRRVAF